MITSRVLGVAACGLVLSTQCLLGQGRARYREFQLGGNLPSVSALAGVQPSEAKTIHARPALMQELQWQRPYSMSDTPAQTDAVKQIVFSFYNDQLFKMAVDYDRDRTAGMTDQDLIDAISTEYGERVKSAGPVHRGTGSVDEESGTPVARWGDPDYSVVLYRSSYASGFRIIVASPRLEGLARTAVTAAARLDEREAPKREFDRQKKEMADARASQEKARLANKAAFKP